jgi:hypothetical protein
VVQCLQRLSTSFRAGKIRFFERRKYSLKFDKKNKPIAFWCARFYRSVQLAKNDVGVRRPTARMRLVSDVRFVASCIQRRVRRTISAFKHVSENE